MNNRCLYCYQPLNSSEHDFHAKCSKKMFGTNEPPLLDFSLQEIDELALTIIQSRITVTGVQPKLSLNLSSNKNEPNRFTIVGVLGDYILKPATKEFANLPENESLMMHLAQIAKIETVPFSLIRLNDNSLAYITKRIDRLNDTKIAMEDFCQLTEKLTEQKYRGSHEQIAKTIERYSTNTQFDMITFYEQVVFSFLVGNSDMHLKNFSLIDDPKKGWSLAPAYDLIATQLVLNDTEELALTLNGKKSRLKRIDFIEAMQKAHMNDRMMDNLFTRFEKSIPKWFNFIEISFLPDNQKEQLKQLIHERVERILL